MNRLIHSVPLDLLDVDRRLRPVSQDHVELIAASMAERGQDTPVTVAEANPQGRHRLIAGGHRVAAARLLGWARIDAEIVAADDLQARLREIDENLMRRELSALDRAVFLAERKKVYEALHPATRRGGNRRGDQTDKDVTLIGVPAFREEAAERLGLDPRSVARIVARATILQDLGEEVAQELKLHPVAESGAELDALLRLDAGKRRAVIEELVLDTPEARARTVREALGRIAGPAATSRAAEAERQLAALHSAWRKAGAAARGQFLDWLADEGLIPAREPAAKGRGR